MKAGLRTGLGPLLMAVITLSCRDDSDPTAPRLDAKPSDPTLAASQLRSPETLDDEFARMARENPGFGGLYYDEGNNLTAYMTDLSRAPAMAAASTAYLRRRGQPAVAAVRVVRGQYDFLQLKTWKDRLARAAFSHPEVVTLDINEAKNRIVVGTLKDAVRRPLLKQAAALGIPRGAVLIERLASFGRTQTLADFIRPVVGALEIRGQGLGACSLGVNVLTRSGINAFITASHCTFNMGQVDNTLFTQPANAGGILGVEFIDPAFGKWFKDCPSTLCRESDAVLVRYSAGVTFTRGSIARTTNPNNFSITIDPARPRFTLSATQGHQTMGQTLSKIGAVTGWTRGVVNATCYQGRVPAQPSLYLNCQYGVTAPVSGGDSGSPVIWEYQAGRYAIVGILWGEARTPTGQFSFQYSSWSGVDFELGVETGGSLRVVP